MFMTQSEDNTAFDWLLCMPHFSMEHGEFSSDQSETFQIFGLREENIIFNQRNESRVILSTARDFN